MKKQGKRSKNKHLSKEAFRKIKHKQAIGKDNDYKVYKEAQTQQQTKLESLNETLSINWHKT